MSIKGKQIPLTINLQAVTAKSQVSRFTVQWLLFFTLIGFGLRLQRLSFQPLWGDEGWSFYFATQPLLQLLALTAIDIHPPLYYLLLKGWLFLTGGGPEAARLLSALVGTLLTPVMAILAARLLGRRTAIAAAAIAAVMPMAIYYAQEVRMYGLVTLLGALSFYFFVRRGDAPRWEAAYVIVTSAALYTMYYAALLVLAQLTFAMWTAFRRPEARSLSRWLRPFVAVGVLYLPWVIYAGPRLVDYISNKRAVEGYTALGPVRFIGDHLLAFSVGHLSAVSQLDVWLALPVLALAAVGLKMVWRIRNKPALILCFYLAVPLLAGYLINLVYPFTPRFFERTLLLAAPAYWLLAAAGLSWLWTHHHLWGRGAAAAMLLAAVISLAGFYTIPRYPEEDYRPLLREVAARATPADTLLASYQWQLGFYHAYLPRPRPRLFPVPDWGAGWSAQAGNASRLYRDLADIFAQSPRLWFPAYQASGHIWEDEAEAAIAALGYPALLNWYSPQTKLTLAGASQTPLETVAPANFGDHLTLLAASVGGTDFEAGRGIVPVTLRWRTAKPLASPHQVSLRLVDSQGRTWAIRDSQPRAGQVPFDELAPGETLPDQHGLLTPAGAPPGTYHLLLSVRRINDAHPLNVLDEGKQPLGAELPLADISLISPQPPLGVDALPVQTYAEAVFDDQIRLLGYSLGAGPFKAGERLPVTLFWQSLSDRLSPLSVSIELTDDTGQAVVVDQQPPAWPTTDWQENTLARDPHDIPLPATLGPGRYQLWLALVDERGQRLPVGRADRFLLETITTIDRPRILDAPPMPLAIDADFGGQARLVGLDLPQVRVEPGATLPLTLLWHATGVFDRNLKVFVHLTDGQGRIVSQQDQIPGGGQFPTTGWLPGEYLVDDYQLAIPPADIPAGPYWLNIGLYDDSGRLPVIKAGAVAGDHITLESWPISIE